MSEKDDLDIITRIIHLGLLTFGTLAYLTSGWAESYKEAAHLGFDVHSWLGMGLAFFMILRVLYGVIGPRTVRFTEWVPCTRDRLLLVWEDILTLLRFRLPERPTHQGLAGIVQTFGLMGFLWMALTGSFMFLYLEPGRKARGVSHFVKELHSFGESAIPIFLALHVGAVIIHALSGNHIWRRMFFLNNKRGT